MQDTDENIKLLVSQIKSLINKQFEDLGNFLGDLLIILEIQATQNKTAFEITKINKLIDKHAGNADQLLAQYRADLVNKVYQLISLLFIDLGKSNTSALP